MRISNFSISPTMIVPGDEVNLSFTVQAQNGDIIGSGGLMLWLAIPGYGEVLAYRDSTFTISIGRIKTVTVKTVLFFDDYKFARGSVVSGFGVALGYYGSRVDVNFPLTMLDAWYRPVINVFVAERSIGGTPNDEGENPLLDIALGCSSEAIPAVMGLHFYYRDRTADEDVNPNMKDLSELITGALAGEIQTLISETFEKSTDWDLVLWFGDAYESITLAVVLPKAFANLHLSGTSTGGACFGGFSKSTEGTPLFESYFPARFYGGIDGVTNYGLSEVETGGRWIDGRKIYRRVVEVNVTAHNSMVNVFVFPEEIEMIRLDGYVIRAGGVYRFSPNWYASGSNHHLIWMETPTRLVALTTANLTGYLITEYIKTVDVGVSD